MKVKSLPRGKAWGGRFREATAPSVEQFTSSFPYDRRLYREDIQASMVHCRMLVRQKIIRASDGKKILSGLQQVLREFDSGAFAPTPQDEDIHMAVERRLHELIGPVAGKLHTARSRNDQVATDLRLYLRRECRQIDEEIRRVQEVLGRMARRELRLIMPGLTHLQPAQPVLLAHHLLAYAFMLERDRERLRELLPRVNTLPLGSGALAGTTFPVDREWVAKQLGFTRIHENSMDAVSDRDFVAEFLFFAALLGVHLSRLAEDFILWANPRFGFIELPDRFATGSSMMPQKKNPDVFELIRGKCGRLSGNLVTILSVLKGLPMTYNRDLQEDKEPLFDSIDTLHSALSVLAELLDAIRFDGSRMAAAAREGFLLATEVADYLASRAVPFREAHEIVGRMVRFCIEHGRTLESLRLEEMRSFSPEFETDVYDWLTLEAAIARRQARGGTSKQSVLRQLKVLGL